VGKLLQGINGPFSGKVGPVVGYMLGNQAVIRSLPGSSKKPLSPKQIHQRRKFALMNDFLGQLQSLLNITYAHIAINMTGSNKAFSYNVMNATRGFYPDLSIDYSMVMLGRGDLPNAKTANTVPLLEGKLEFSWIDNSGTGKAKATDKAFVAVYNEELNDWEYDLNLSTRGEGICVLDASLLKGKPVHTYLGFITEDGKDVTDTLYAGEINLL
jgi:Family of unknown function (DUF6266)